ncbi:tpst-1 [Pristionchus pacificus]|nr:tpst-1 [Pristionchus pacificus]
MFRRGQKMQLICCVVLLTMGAIYFLMPPSNEVNSGYQNVQRALRRTYDQGNGVEEVANHNEEVVELHRKEHSITSDYGPVTKDSPMIFIGGVPRSGTTLMRAMLDAHPDVRCGEETRVIPRILGLRAQWKRSEKEWNRLMQAGVTSDVINRAVSAFLLEVIAGHGKPAKRLCNKDPFTMKSAGYLSEIFPNAKYLFMIRDGRATVHSIITREVTITGFDLTSYRQSLEKWNTAISFMNDQCESVKDKCLKVKYEDLVLHPESMMRKILSFLDIEWNPSVLHHEEHIGKEISLSNVERSSDQVVKPVNVDALTKWVGAIPQDVIADMSEIAPMLEKLGYDPNSNPPNYGKPDEIVEKKTDDIHKNANEWYNRAVQVVNDANRVERPDGIIPAAEMKKNQVAN